eukprot:11566680-Heterocapsa_arctica.AAC.1
METEYIMERGFHTGKDRAYIHIPRHKTASKTESGKDRCGQTDEGGGKEYHPDEEDVLQFLRDCGGTE